jgi:hypothetical protein
MQKKNAERREKGGIRLEDDELVGRERGSLEISPPMFTF